MAMVEADKVRPMPKVSVSGDQDLIKMAMVGTFLSTYYTARKFMEALDAAQDTVESIPSFLDSWYMTQAKIAFPKAAIASEIYKRVKK